MKTEEELKAEAYDLHIKAFDGVNPGGMCSAISLQMILVGLKVREYDRHQAALNRIQIQITEIE